MNRFMFSTSARALMAADGATGGAAVADAGGVAAAASPPSNEVAAAPPAASTTAPAEGATPAAPAADAKPAGDSAPAPDSSPSLLEAAGGKPKADGASADAKLPADPATDASKDAKVETPAPADAKPPEAAKDAAKDPGKAPDPAKEATAEAQPPAAKTYEPFKTPEGVKLGDKELKAFTDVIGPDQLPQETAQNLVDLYLSETKRIQAEAEQHQRDVWSAFNDTRKSELRNDPEVGGNRLDTSLAIAKAVVEEFGGTPAQKAAFFERISDTKGNGMGNDVGLIRILNNIGVKLNIFEDKIVPANPVAPTMPKTRAERLYGKPNGAGAQAT